MKDVQSTCRAISVASTEEQVIAVVREYLASLDPADAAVLPIGLTSLGVSHVEEVVQSALQIVHREMLGGHEEPAAALLKEASLVFSTAAQRLAVLVRQPGEAVRK